MLDDVYGLLRLDDRNILHPVVHEELARHR
jgi:hypothetical protein